MQAASKLFNAAKRGKIDEINSLLAAGTDPNVLDGYDVAPIYYTASNGHEAACMALLEVTDISVLSNEHSYYANTALYKAVEKGLINFINAAFAKGADPNALYEHNVALVYYAVYHGREEAAMALLELTDTRLLSNKHSNYGHTVLHIAATWGYVDFIKAVLTKKVDPNALNNRNLAAIYYAVSENHESAAMTLLEVTDIHLLSNRHSLDRMNALHRAAERGWVSFIKAAVAKGLDLYAKDETGQCALDIIIASNRFNLDQINEILAEAAWTRRSALIFLRSERKSARYAAYEAEHAAKGGSGGAATPDA